MRRSPMLPLALVGLVVIGLGLLGPGGFAVAAPGVAAGSTVQATVTGATVLSYNTSAFYTINASGGPAFAANGTLVGNLTYYASVAGANTTGVSVVPARGGFVNATTPEKTQLTVGNLAETITITIEVASVYQTANSSTNLTYLVQVVQPYVLTLHLVSQSSSTILGFDLTVYLDGAAVGVLSIPTLTAHQDYTATFRYATTGLSAGAHTFTVTLSSQHGLVTFSGGTTTYSTTFYVPGPPPNYDVWYIAGAVAFFGAIFIFATRVAARRRNPSRK
ncbi:MAG: hypothetical protein ACRECT_03110 [Thermoplasmata archaeon]